MRASVGEYQSAALAITRLGYAYFTVESTSADTTAEVTAQMTDVYKRQA